MEASLDPRATAARLREIGVSQSYASLIVHGKQEPSDDLAVHIYRHAGLRFGRLKAMTEAEAKKLAAVWPGEWKPRAA